MLWVFIRDDHDEGRDGSALQISERDALVSLKEGEGQPPTESVKQATASDRIDATLAQWKALLPVYASPDSVPIRFWFSNEREFYVEYGRKESQPEGMIFLVSGDGKNSLSISRKSAYITGESDWMLKEGEDVRFIKPQRDLYEKNPSGEWQKIN